jgi:hypothetical protein
MPLTYWCAKSHCYTGSTSRAQNFTTLGWKKSFNWQEIEKRFDGPSLFSYLVVNRLTILPYFLLVAIECKPHDPPMQLAR